MRLYPCFSEKDYFQLRIYAAEIGRKMSEYNAFPDRKRRFTVG